MPGRLVTVVGGLVFKVDGEPHGGCAREALVWALAARDGWDEILCPVLASGRLPDGRGWVLMPEAEVASWRDPAMPALRVRLFEYGIVDTGQGNAGRLDGRLVAIDYEL